MEKALFEYSILLSCPSDVTEEIAIVKSVIREFNNAGGNRTNFALAVITIKQMFFLVQGKRYRMLWIRR